METRAVGVVAIRDVHAGAVKRGAAVVRKGTQIVATLHSLLTCCSEREPRRWR